jgi:hypothetical protein
MINAFIDIQCNKEIHIVRQLTVYEQVIIDTGKERDAFDSSLEGKLLKPLKGRIARLQKKEADDEDNDKGDDDIDDEEEEEDDDNCTATINNHVDIVSGRVPMSNIEQCEAELKPLLTKRNAMAEKLKQTRLCVSEKNKI